MDVIVKILKNEPRVDSRMLAERLGINHKALINQIRSYKTDFQEFGIMPFKKAKIKSKGRPQTITYLNENQAVLLLTYSKNTAKVRDLKKQLVKDFAEARKRLAARKDGKRSRHIAMDAVKLLVDQAVRQGSSSPQSYYLNITKAAYSLLFGGKIDRDNMTLEQLQIMAVAESVIRWEINEQLKADPDVHYKAIYQSVKARLKRLTETIFPGQM